MKKWDNRYYFSLVELIVVLAIIIVVATGIFLVFSQWIGKSKDSRRMGDIAVLEKTMELAYTTNLTGGFPMPDQPISVKTDENGIVWYQGYFGPEVKEKVDNLDKLPTDPSGDYYFYSVSANYQSYQVMAVLENGDHQTTYTNKVLANNKQKAYVKGFFDGYLVVKNPSKTFMLVNSPTLFVKKDILDSFVSGGTYITYFSGDIVDDNEYYSFPAQVKTGDVSSLFNSSDDTITINMINQNFTGLLENDLLNQIILSNGGNPSYIRIKGTCTNGEKDGFLFSSIMEGDYDMKSRDVVITNGKIVESMTATCSNGLFIYSPISSQKICDDGYVLYNDNCVLDICDGDVPLNGEQNGVQKVGYSREYSLVSGICKYKCIDGYHLENGECIPNTKLGNCSGSIPSNTANNSSGSINFIQTWNGIGYDPGVKIRSYNETIGECNFVCDVSSINANERYYWNGSGCELLSSPEIIVSGKTDTSITIQWNEIVGADNYSLKVGSNSWNNLGNITNYTILDLQPGTEYQIQLIASKNYLDTFINSLSSSSLSIVTECSSGFHLQGGVCVSNNCGATSKSVGTNVYNIPFTIDGAVYIGVSAAISIDNGTITYSQAFQCELGEFIQYGEQTTNEPQCNSGYFASSYECLPIRYWTGDSVNGFKFYEYGTQNYPISCNDLLTSSNPNFKYGTSLVYNGTKFLDGVYWIKPNSTAVKLYCDMTSDGGGWTFIGKSVGTTTTDLITNDSLGDYFNYNSLSSVKVSTDNINGLLFSGNRLLKVTNQLDGKVWLFEYASGQTLSFVNLRSYTLRLTEPVYGNTSPYYISHPHFIAFVGISRDESPIEGCKTAYERISYGKYLNDLGRYLSYCQDASNVWYPFIRRSGGDNVNQLLNYTMFVK